MKRKGTHNGNNRSCAFLNFLLLKTEPRPLCIYNTHFTPAIHSSFVGPYKRTKGEHSLHHSTKITYELPMSESHPLALDCRLPNLWNYEQYISLVYKLSSLRYYVVII